VWDGAAGENREDSSVRFLADAMFGRLARWLRVLGWDTAYDPAASDPSLVDWARLEDRVLLTRDRPLVRELRPERAVLIATQRPLDQLRQVVADVGLDLPAELFTRCLVCTTPLRAATDLESATLVPPEARVLPGPVRRCPGCGRVYWPGSHARRMRAALSRAFPEWRPG
jgi:uncharacterized protein with PIN domain